MLGNSHIKKSDREDQTVPVSARETIKRQREREREPSMARTLGIGGTLLSWLCERREREGEESQRDREIPMLS